jgi:hypothetical protein
VEAPVTVVSSALERGSGALADVVKRVEAELGEFWSTPLDVGEAELPKVRASTMNLVVLAARGREEAAREELLAVAESHAGRMFLLTVDGRLPPWDATSEASAVCRVDGGAVPICYDRVELAFGALAAERAGSCVRALSLPEVPTVVDLSRGNPAGQLEQSLVRVADRLIIDSSRAPVSALAPLARDARYTLADRTFVRNTSWRELVARSFDDAPSLARAVRRVRVGRTPASSSAHDPAPMILGWLASRLGWSFASRELARDARGDDVAIELVTFELAGCGAGELVEISLDAERGGAAYRFDVTRLPGEGGAPPRRVRWKVRGARDETHLYPLGHRDEGWVLLMALDATAGDRVVREAILAAERWEAA